MTFHTKSVITISCDDPRHVGERGSVLNHGAAYSALAALKRTGWSYSAVTQELRCPECIAIAKARN